jgi:hypothetical protein
MAGFIGYTSSRMLHRTFSRRFLWLRLLRGGLVAGAVYDLVFAVLMVGAPELPARWFALPLPGETFYLWLIAAMLAMLAMLYLAAARDPRRYSAIIAVAILGRGAGALVFALAAGGRPDLAGLWILSAADLGFALFHALSWLPLRT